MRQLAVLIVTVGVLAAPAFAQYPPPVPTANLAGSWTATLYPPSGVTTVRFDLTQGSAGIEGRETISGPGLAVALRVSGWFSGSRTGTIQQTQVEQLRGMPNYYLQVADFESTGPNTLSLYMRPSGQYKGGEVIALTRVALANPVLTRYPTPPPPKPAFLNGSWVGTVNRPNGPLTLRLNLTQTGDSVGGREIASTGRGAAAIRLNGEVTGERTATLQEMTIEQQRGSTTWCLQSGELSVMGPNTVSIQWLATDRCRASTVTLTRERPGATTAPRNSGVTPGEALLMMLLQGIGGDSTPSSGSGEDESQRQLENAQRSCQSGSSYDCYRANIPPPPSDPPNE